MALEIERRLADEAFDLLPGSYCIKSHLLWGHHESGCGFLERGRSSADAGEGREEGGGQRRGAAAADRRRARRPSIAPRRRAPQITFNRAPLFLCTHATASLLIFRFLSHCHTPTRVVPHALRRAQQRTQKTRLPLCRKERAFCLPLRACPASQLCTALPHRQEGRNLLDKQQLRHAAGAAGGGGASKQTASSAAAALLLLLVLVDPDRSSGRVSSTLPERPSVSSKARCITESAS